MTSNVTPGIQSVPRITPQFLLDHRGPGSMPPHGFNAIDLLSSNLSDRLDLRDTEYPYFATNYFVTWRDSRASNTRLYDVGDDGVPVTYYGMILSGQVRVQASGTRPDGSAVSMDARVGAGMYFVMPAPFHLTAVAGDSAVMGMLIARVGYTGYPQVGGPLEATGRLKYIDTCSDTLLVCPPVKGDPCLNHLHIPAGVDQTAHTHPSERIGVILSGSGYCLAEREGATVAEVDLDDPHTVVIRDPAKAGRCRVMTRLELKAGMGWRIPTGLLHSFHTEGEALDVLAWHPESTFGPSHEAHPMLDRSYVGDTSAADIPAIQTREITA